VGGPGLKSLLVGAAIVVAVGLGVLAAGVLRAPDDATPRIGTDGQAATTTRTPSNRTPSPIGGAPGSDTSTGPAASASRIETTSLTYFGRPFETIEIQGWYRGAPGRTRLRVQLERFKGWTQYPLAAVTQPSGKFRAFVELGEAGEHRLRIVDPKRGYSSAVLTLLVF